jgi:hypothetical protein
MQYVRTFPKSKPTSIMERPDQLGQTRIDSERGEQTTSAIDLVRCCAGVLSRHAHAHEPSNFITFEAVPSAQKDFTYREIKCLDQVHEDDAA